MAKIVILIGRGESGKTSTINKVGEKLGLTKYETRYKAGYPSFVTWVGEAQEIFLKTSSIQEEVKSKVSRIFAQTGSIQEKNKAILDEVLKETEKWIDFLKDKSNAIAIIPFTLTGGKNAMEDLILKPLELFKQSGNEVKTVYLKKDNIQEKNLVEHVINKVNPDLIIKSVEDEEERQAQELLDYLKLKPFKKIEVAPLGQFI